MAKKNKKSNNKRKNKNKNNNKQKINNTDTPKNPYEINIETIRENWSRINESCANANTDIEVNIPSNPPKKVSITEYNNELMKALNESDMVSTISPYHHYTNSILRKTTDEMITTLGEEETMEAHKFMIDYNNQSSYIRENPKLFDRPLYESFKYYDLNHFIYSKDHRQQGKVTHSRHLHSLTNLYREKGVNAKVFLMQTTMKNTILKDPMNTVVANTFKYHSLGNLQPDIVLPLSSNIDSYICFLMVVASNGIISVGHPFILTYNNEKYEAQVQKEELIKEFLLALLMEKMLNQRKTYRR